MKMSKEELKGKVNELVKDNDVAISLLEDIEDSMEVEGVDTSAVDELQAKLEETQGKLNDLQEKYKQRFLEGKEEKKEEKTEELEEKEVIDIKEI